MMLLALPDATCAVIVRELTHCARLLWLCNHCSHKQQAAAVAQYKQQRSELCEYTAAVAESLHTWVALVPWNARIQWCSSDYLDKMATDANGLPVLRGHAVAVEQEQRSEDAAVQQGCANKGSSMCTVKENAAEAAAAAAAPEWIAALATVQHSSTALQCAGG
jgi:hypothetical protein